MRVRTPLYLAVVSLAALSVEASGKAPLVELNDGHKMPSYGLGTWLGFLSSNSEADSIEKAVGVAIDAGYRHIDTAYIYFNEDQVGRAVNKKINDGVVTREEMFITTKLWNDRHERADVVAALREALTKMNLTYVDLFLVHWPIATHQNNSVDNSIDYTETWLGMIEAQEQGLARSIGVSNFNEQFLRRLVDDSPVRPAVLQVEVNLNIQQPELLEYCRQQNIVVMGYSPFGSVFKGKSAPKDAPPRATDPEMVELAKKYNKTVAQIVLRYLLELGVVPIPKSVHKARIEENIDIFDFTLEQRDREMLRSFDRNLRTIDPKWWKSSIYYPFEKN